MSANDNANIYLILDNANHPLGRGEMETLPDAEQMRMLVLDHQADEVADHQTVLLLSMGRDELPMACKILRQRGDKVILEKIASLDPDVRRNLRVNVEFESFIYPVSGAWRGRRHVRSIDLSCGGVAFTGEPGLGDHEIVEIIIPVTLEAPVLLHCELLRIKPLEDGSCFYASKFVDMCESEEMVVRETVFSLQLASRPKQ